MRGLSPSLYLIEILHQTTTPFDHQQFRVQLYLIEILHQTTTLHQAVILITVVSY